MVWKTPEKCYNDGAFNVCVRVREALVVTTLADNYFGLCKKEVETQLTKRMCVCLRGRSPRTSSRS